MELIDLPSFRLVGLRLPGKTTNNDGQSAVDCGKLWRRFATENIASQITDKASDEVIAVYYDYEGDHTEPFSYFIGCKVANAFLPPKGLDTLTVPRGLYRQVVATGKMPQCVADAWRRIWSSGIRRSYQYDFEVYDERSRDWNTAEVDIFVSA